MCGCKGHFTKDCKASPYLVELYKELQQFRNRACQNYNFKTLDLPNLDYYVENYITVYEQPMSNPDVALLDSASIHINLTNAQFFHSQNKKFWFHCKILIIARSRTLRFREGRTIIILSGRFSSLAKRQCTHQTLCVA